jgi:hypothetical protein
VILGFFIPAFMRKTAPGRERKTWPAGKKTRPAGKKNVACRKKNRPAGKKTGGSEAFPRKEGEGT